MRAALEGVSLGLIDNWLRHIQDVRDQHELCKDTTIDIDIRWKALCELNVIDQVRNIARTTIVGHAWRRNQNLTLHGWVYGLNNGLLKDLNVSIVANANIDEIVRLSIANVYSGYQF